MAGSYSATEQVSLALQGTGLSIGDADAGGASVTATVSVVSGCSRASTDPNERADAYVVKSRLASDLPSAIEEAVAGRKFVSPTLRHSGAGSRS